MCIQCTSTVTPIVLCRFIRRSGATFTTAGDTMGSNILTNVTGAAADRRGILVTEIHIIWFHDD